MNLERRLVLFLVFSVLIMWGMPLMMQRMGLLPKPRANPAAAKAPARPEAGKPAQEPPKVAANDQPADKDKPPAAEPTKPEPAAPADAPKVAEVDPAKLLLGSVDPKSPYRIEVQLTQRGAGISRLRSSRFEAEIKEGQKRGQPLVLIAPDDPAKRAIGAPASLSLNVVELLDRKPADNPDAATAEPEGAQSGATASDRRNLMLDDALWELADGPKPVKKRAAPPAAQEVEGQEVTFKTTTGGLNVSKTFRLWPNEDSLELEIALESPDKSRKLLYELLGPHGLPIEGEWYTGTFRDVFMAGYTPSGDQILTRSAYDVVKRQADPERLTSLPLKYAGVENQYFALFVEPLPVAESLDQSWISETRGVVVHSDPTLWQKADVTVQLQTRPLEPAPNRPIRHGYRIYAGPKTAEALSAVGAFELSSYRKGWHLPLLGDLGAQFLSKNVIAPMLSRIYKVTAAVARFFGGQRGNYGVAIILLTVCVRLLLFPLGRKQARAAQRMQELQPHLAELKAKCGDDKEKFAREQFALFKKHNVNPMGGCLPALVQLPVMIGLWQALNNSVALRHSRFLWIDNLAAPDMLFKFPVPIPLVGQWLGPYFNLLPLVVVVLMLIQTKLFAPPATTPEAESQQAMMKYMMIFMAFMFYKVPSGLGIYFITSSLWQIGERLLLPKLTPKVSLEAAGTGGIGGTGGSAGALAPAKPTAPASSTSVRPDGSKGGWFAQVREQARERMEQLMEDAAKDRTVRNDADRDRDRSSRPRRDDNRKRPR